MAPTPATFQRQPPSRRRRSCSPARRILEAVALTAPCGRARSIWRSRLAGWRRVRHRCDRRSDPGRCHGWLSADERPIAGRVRGADGAGRAAPAARRESSITAPLFASGPLIWRSAVDALAAILADMATEPASHEVTLPCASFAGTAAPCWSTCCRRPTSTIGRCVNGGSPRCRRGRRPSIRRGAVSAAGSTAVAVAGVVIATPLAGPSFDDSRRHLWSLADGDRRGWAGLLDRFDESMVLRSDDPALGIRSLLG